MNKVTADKMSAAFQGAIDRAAKKYDFDGVAEEFIAEAMGQALDDIHEEFIGKMKEIIKKNPKLQQMALKAAYDKLVGT